MEYEILRLKGTKLYVITGIVNGNEIEGIFSENPYSAKKYFGGDLVDSPLLKFCERVTIKLTIVD